MRDDLNVRLDAEGADCTLNGLFVGSWSQEEDAAVMQRLKAVHGKLAAQGRLGPVARLLPTTAATTLRTTGDSSSATTAVGRCLGSPLIA